jgi:hypothetical protein
MTWQHSFELFSYIINGSYQTRLPELQYDSEELLRRLASRGRSLLEIVQGQVDFLLAALQTGNTEDLLEQENDHASRVAEGRKHFGVVQFIHQTAKEFAQKESSTSIFLTSGMRYSEETGDDFLFRYCLQVAVDGQVHEVPELLHHAFQVKQRTGMSQGRMLDRLMPIMTDDCWVGWPTWDPLFKSDPTQYIDGQGK